MFAVLTDISIFTYCATGTVLFVMACWFMWKNNQEVNR